MVPLTHLDGQSIGVFGLARSGLATVRAAIAGGAADVVVWDDKEAAREKAEALGGIADPAGDWPWERLESLVLAPGVPLTHPAPHPDRRPGQGGRRRDHLRHRASVARDGGPGALRRRSPAPTASRRRRRLLGHVLAVAGPVSVGGNIGRAALDLEPPGERPHLRARDVVLPARPDAPLPARRRDLAEPHARPSRPPRRPPRLRQGEGAHLRQHGSGGHGDRRHRRAGDAGGRRRAEEPGTAAARHRLGRQEQGRHALRRRRAARCSRASGAKALLRRPADAARPAQLAERRRSPGRAAKALGLYGGIILSAMESFPGLAHRMEVDRPARIGALRQRFQGDQCRRGARARSPPSTRSTGSPAARRRRAASSRSKEYFPRIAKAYLIGTAADEFSEMLAGRVPHVIAGDLDTAVRMAAADAAIDGRPEPTVLLSPACASFDQFADFEARGEAFRRAVAALDEEPRWRRSHDQPRPPLAPVRLVVDRRPADALARPGPAPRPAACSPSRRARRSPSASASTACTSCSAMPSTRRSPRWR